MARPHLSVCVAALLIACYCCQLPLQREDDSAELYRGVQNIVDWQQGLSKTIGHARPFPLFQYLSGVAAEWAVRKGVPCDIYSFWSACSLLSLAGIVIIFGNVARRTSRPTLGWAMAVLILSGPLLMYARSTFNELVSALLILAFTAAVMGTTTSVVCALLFWISGITKETAPPLLALIWLGALWIQRRQLDRRQMVSHLAMLPVALLLTLATNSAFNFLRFGSVWNLEYLSPIFLVHSWPRRLQYCIALWLSPNAGVVAFWPTLAIFIIGLLAIAFRRRQAIAPEIVVAVILGALTLGLSGWYGPFGFWCWGPRLMLPWLPALALILVQSYPAECTQLIDRFTRSRRAFVLTSAVVCLLALPHVMAATDPAVVGRFFETNQPFVSQGKMIDPDEHYARNMYLVWRKTPPMLILPMIDQITLLRVLTIAGFEAALVILLWNARLSMV